MAFASGNLASYVSPLGGLETSTGMCGVLRSIRIQGVVSMTLFKMHPKMHGCFHSVLRANTGMFFDIAFQDIFDMHVGPR